MSAYWYISKDKLGALPLKQSLHKRLFGRAKLSMGPASVEGGIDAGGESSLAESVVAAERSLRKDGEVAPLSEEAKPPGSPYFEFEGAAVRTIQEGGLWTAVASAEKAVLLGGSATNAIGASSDQPGPSFSPSANPVRALEGLEKGLSPTEWSSLSYIWDTLMEKGTELIEIDALPRVRGIAVYAGLASNEGSYPIVSRMTYTVVGSPLFIEQIS